MKKILSYSVVLFVLIIILLLIIPLPAGLVDVAIILNMSLSMMILVKTVCKKVPKLMEYSLGIAMIIGMIFSVGYDQLFR